jgi:hypothetical protein
MGFKGGLITIVTVGLLGLSVVITMILQLASVVS